MKRPRKLLVTAGLLALLITAVVPSLRRPALPALPLAGQLPNQGGLPSAGNPVVANVQPPIQSVASASSSGVATTLPGTQLDSGVANLAATAPIPGQAASPPSALKNLHQTGQAPLWAALGAARRAVTPLNEYEATLPQNVGVRYFAANPSQQLTARFLDGAVRIESGLGGEWRGTLRFVGGLLPEGASSTAPQRLPPPIARDHRVEYHHPGGITEWYENCAEGIEHGFTVNQRPESAAQAGELRVNLQLDGLTTSTVADDTGVPRSDIVRFHDPSSGRPVVSYGQLKVWDAMHRELVARLEAHDSAIAILVADANATYPLTIDPLIVSEEAKLLPEFGDGASYDFFGIRVALAGETAVIGASGEDTAAGANVGSAYVFVRHGGVWSLQQKIVAPDGAAGDAFGSALETEANTLIIGAWGNDHPSGVNAGAAYVFVRSGTTWSLQQKLVAGTPEPNAEFGASVAISGDTVAIGAVLGDTSRGVDTGIAYVFVRRGTVWSQQAVFAGSDVNPDDRFAAFVAISGDTILAGAHGHDLTGVASQGAAYVFTRSGTTWSQQQKLIAGDATANDDFGRAVALDGDTAVVGAHLDDVGQVVDAGSAYVFVRTGTVWSQQQQLSAPTPVALGTFGRSASVRGDRIIIGARSGSQGRAYVFVRSGALWSLDTEFASSDRDANTGFGDSVAISGTTALVGEVLDDVQGVGTDAGSASVFVRNNAVWSQQGQADPPPDFTDAPIYEIGEIPFQTVWNGQETKFRVRASALGAGTVVSAGYVKPPSGTLYFDAGNFLYRPGVNDKAEFSVTFTAAVGANRLEQIVPVQPIPLLPSEGDLLGVERKGVPDPTSRDFLAISDVKDVGQTQFNHALRQLRTVTLSGKEVVLREGHANRLFESYAGNTDIREFHINAEKVVVGSSIRLPGTKVVIRARQLEFQDHGGQVSQVSTQPVDYDNPPSQTTIAGGPGLTGGDLEIYVESLALPPVASSHPVRFITRGGTGQDGAPGRDGAPGPNLKPVDPDHFTAVPPLEGLPSTSIRNSTTCIAVDSDRNARWDVFTSVRVGDPRVEILQADNTPRSGVTSWVLRSEWKPDGEAATAGGDPGNGGSAGRIKSSLALALQLTDTSGGTPGSTPGYQGGGPGTPSPAYYYVATDKLILGQPNAVERRGFELAATHLAISGLDASAKIGTTGGSGTKEQGANPMAWLSSQALRQVVNHVNAAYLEGEVDFVYRTVADYLGQLAQLRASPAWASVGLDHQRDFALLEEELGLLAHRSISGLDYFGNPPGWVPLLSLEANKLAFEQEIDRAIGILYLEYWLSGFGTTLQSKIGALTDARKKLAADSEKLAQDFDDANALLPNLEARVDELAKQTASVQGSIKLLETELLRDAKDNLKVPLWRRVAKGLGSVCKLVPVPWFQAVGKGLDVVSNFNVDKPWDSIQGVVDVVDAYRDGDFGTKAKALNASYKKIKFPELPDNVDPGAIKGFIDDVQTAAKPIVGKLQGVQKAFQSNQAPKSQIEAELAKLKAESKEFKLLGDHVSTLLTQKEAFAQQVSQTIQLLGGLSENITGNLLAMDALNEDYAQAAGALDDRALMYLKEIGRRARERLLLYHYYVKKAYEYRLLRPYPGRLDLQKLFDSFRTLAENGDGTYQQLTGPQFNELRGIYDDVLGELVKEVVVEYNKNAAASTGPRRFLLTASELEKLNQGKEVVVNLQTIGGSGLFPKHEENLRIANISILKLGLESTAGANSTDFIELKVVHGGESVLRTSANNEPRSYRFLHYSTGTEVPIQWRARYFPTTETLRQVGRSLSADSLLGALLKNSGYVPGQMGYFTQPGALAELRLAVTPGSKFRLNEVLVEIEYEFLERRQSVRSLEVTTADGLAPYLEVSTPDLGGRQDGLGAFERTYSSGAQVTLSAPDRIGNLRFAGFVDLNQGGFAALAQPNELITIQREPRRIGRHAPAQFDGTRHQLALNLSADQRIEVQYLTIEELQLGISGNPADGSLKLLLDGERYTPFRLESAPTVQGPWSPLLDGTLIAPEERTVLAPGIDSQFYRLLPR